ncbi:MAG: response regulator [Methanobacterium sp.]|nr:response regulator [Methanobacterium sp.]
MKASRILLIENECIIAMEIQNSLLKSGYKPFTANSGENGLKMALEIKPDLIIIDTDLKALNEGIKTAKRIREVLEAPIIYLTAYFNEKLQAELTKPSAIILKPFNTDELINTIKTALYGFESEELKNEIGDLK